MYELLLDGKVVYVGITVQPDQRLKEHQADKPNGADLTMRIVRWFECRKEAEHAERNRIKQLEPELNISANAMFLYRKQWTE